MFVFPDGRPIKCPEYEWKKACHGVGKPGFLIHDMKRSAGRQTDLMGIDRDVFREMCESVSTVRVRKDSA